VVDGVSIGINEGEVVGLLGPNGAGKTTTFYMVVGMIKPDRGRVYFGDRDITRMPMYRRARIGVGYLSQEPSVFRKLTVEENIYAILEMMPITKAERHSRLHELMRELGVDHVAKNKAYAISGGERRRLEIARALVTSPSFLLLDEPFAGVDPIAVFDIQQIIARLKAKNIGILITDHNVRDTLEIVDRAYIMNEGKILISGTAQQLIDSEEARKIYLGEKFQM
jgi:lipopolysaccharide export system ATP-binding protein